MRKRIGQRILYNDTYYQPDRTIPSLLVKMEDNIWNLYQNVHIPDHKTAIYYNLPIYINGRLENELYDLPIDKFPTENSVNKIFFEFLALFPKLYITCRLMTTVAAKKGWIHIIPKLNCIRVFAEHVIYIIGDPSTVDMKLYFHTLIKLVASKYTLFINMMISIYELTLLQKVLTEQKLLGIHIVNINAILRKFINGHETETAISEEEYIYIAKELIVNDTLELPDATSFASNEFIKFIQIPIRCSLTLQDLLKSIHLNADIYVLINELHRVFSESISTINNFISKSPVSHILCTISDKGDILCKCTRYRYFMFPNTTTYINTNETISGHDTCPQQTTTNFTILMTIEIYDHLQRFKNRTKTICDDNQVCNITTIPRFQKICSESGKQKAVTFECYDCTLYKIVGVQVHIKLITTCYLTLDNELYYLRHVSRLDHFSNIDKDVYSLLYVNNMLKQPFHLLPSNLFPLNNNYMCN